MLRMQFRRIWKNRVFLSFFLLSIISSIGSLFYRFNKLMSLRADPLNYLEATLLHSYFVFFFCLFFSFEFTYKFKENSVAESIEFSESATIKFYLSAGTALAISLFVYTIIAFLTNIFVAGRLEVLRTEYLTHIGLNLVLNILLLGCLGILLGSALTTSRNRMVAYLAMILSSVLVSPINELISVPLAHVTQLNVFSIFDIFAIFPPLLRAAPLYPFGYSVLPYRFYLIFFWVFFFAGIITMRVWKTAEARKAVRKLLCFTLATVFFGLYLMPASKVTRDKVNQTTGIFADAFYYEEDAFEKEQASFQIASYKLKLRISRRLDVICAITADRPFANQDTLTLYHGYKVEKIVDDDHNHLAYIQQGDSVTLNGMDGETTCITLYYSGSSSIFYANGQGVFLPGNFPYYPFPGKTQIYSSQMQSFLPNQLRQSAEFDVTAESVMVLHSNLPQVGSNHFQGDARSLTLLGGMYEMKAGYAGVDVLVPYLAQAEARDDTIQTEIQTTMANDPTFDKIQKIMLIPNLNFVSVYSQFIRFDDYALSTQIRGLDARNLATQVPWQKSTLSSVLNNYKYFQDVYKGQMQDFQEELLLGGSENLVMKTYFFFQDSLDRFGENTAIESVESFLDDESDERSGLEYLRDLLEG